MSTQDFITKLFYHVDERIGDVPKHPQAKLYPSEIVTLALLFALKGSDPRAFPRWLQRDYLALFPTLPERTRLFRLFAAHRDWAEYFLAEPTVLGVADSYGIELLHPMREGRSRQQIGRTGKSNQRWIVGVKLAYIVNQRGLVVAWDSAPANVYDAVFHPLIADFADDMVVFTDMGFHAKGGDPPTMKPCPRNTWNVRMVVETVLAMLTRVCQLKKMSQRRWPYVLARLSFTMALFNLLVQWNGLHVGDGGHIPLSMAHFSLWLAPFVSSGSETVIGAHSIRWGQALAALERWTAPPALTTKTEQIDGTAHKPSFGERTLACLYRLCNKSPLSES